MNPRIMIIGYIEPDTEENTTRQLDALLSEIENPTIIYNGDDETAEKIRLYCATGKTAYVRDMEKNPQRNRNRMIAADYFIVLGHSSRLSVHVMNARSNYDYLLARSAQITPQEDPPRKPRPTCDPTGKKATGKRRSRRGRRL